MAASYFKKLYAESPVHLHGQIEILQSLPRLNQDQIQKIQRPVSFEELKEVIFGLHPDKAPGLDGFTMRFFQRFWGIVGEDVFRVIHSFYYRGHLLKCINEYA